jgi:hypothetical protein
MSRKSVVPEVRLHEALDLIEAGVCLPNKSKLGLSPLRAFDHGQAVRLPYALSDDEYGPILRCAIPVSQGGGLASTSSGGANTDKIDMTTPRRRNNSLPGQTTVPSFPDFETKWRSRSPHRWSQRPANQLLRGPSTGPVYPLHAYSNGLKDPFASAELNTQREEQSQRHFHTFLGGSTSLGILACCER